MLLLKKSSLFFLTTVLMTSLFGCDSSTSVKKNDSEKTTHSSNEVNIDTASGVDIKQISEALGHFIGRNLNSPGIHFDLEKVIQGIREGSLGKPAPMTDQDYEKAMGQLQQKAVEALAIKNLEAANTFMKENMKTEGIIEIVPGKLQGLVLVEGHGAAVPEHGTPLITYTGKFIDGSVFGSSEAAGGPISVPIDQTLPGFSKGIVGMKEGGKRRLFVHPEMGYGAAGQLPPNSLLIFDIEVIKAESPEKETADAFQSKINNDLSDEADNLSEDSDEDEFDEQEAPDQKVVK